MEDLIAAILVVLILGGLLHGFYLWGYSRGYEDGDRHGYESGLDDANTQFQNMCDEAIKKKEDKQR